MEAGIPRLRLRDLGFSDAIIIGRSMLLLACIQTLVRLTGLRRTLVWAERLAQHRVAIAEELDLQHATRLIFACCRRWPFGTTCLERSLVVLALLGRQGSPLSLCIGFRRGDSGVEGHAWIEHGPRPIAETLDVKARDSGQALLAKRRVSRRAGRPLDW
jgi:Transglutaminase-like superfamily